MNTQPSSRSYSTKSLPTSKSLEIRTCGIGTYNFFLIRTYKLPSDTFTYGS